MATPPDEPQLHQPKTLDSIIVDQLVLEMLRVIRFYVDNDDDTPASLVKLHVIADKDEGWLQVVSSMVNVIPLEEAMGPLSIPIVFEECPLPSKKAVVMMTKMFALSKKRAEEDPMDNFKIRTDRNICIILSCIAEKFAGPNSTAVFTQDTLEYLISFLVARREPCLVLFALIALEKFAHTDTNKIQIQKQFDMQFENPLLVLEKLAFNKDYGWRQVGLCAKWALDNIFVVEGRLLSYLTVDMSNITVILNPNDMHENMKLSCDGLEVRCDASSFESIRSTHQVDSGCCYYECEIITPGVMQIGWATKSSNFLNTSYGKTEVSSSEPIKEGFGIGEDLCSIAYDGCRRLLWYNAKPVAFLDAPKWKPGDILGCLIDLTYRTVIFTLNGNKLPAHTEIFDTIGSGFFAAASFMSFQQCRFNFGHMSFKFAPKDHQFTTFNDYGGLTDKQKQVVPRRIKMEQQKNPVYKEDACTICCDESANCVLEPCRHRGFCKKCMSQLEDCPMCRGPIVSIRDEDIA